MRRAVAALSAVAVVRFAFCAWLSLAHHHDIARFVRPDSLVYLALARNLHAFIDGSDASSYLRTPGYPVFLRLVQLVFGSSPLAWALVQSLLACALGLSLYFALSVILPDSRRYAAFFSSLLALLDLPSALHGLLALTETLFTLLFTAGLLLGAIALKRDRLAYSALGAGLLGCALMVRPVLLLFGLVSCTFSLLAPGLSRKRRALHALVLCLGTAGSACSWVAHNEQRTGHAFFTTAESNFVYLHCAVPTVARARQVSDETALRWLNAELAARVGPNADEFVAVAEKSRLARAVFVQHPWQLARVFAESALKIMLGPGEYALGVWLGPVAPLARWYVLMFLAASYALALFGVLDLYVQKNWFLMALLVLPVGYLLVVSSGNQGYSRFRLPMTPLLCTCAGLGARRALLLLRAARSGFPPVVAR